MEPIQNEWWQLGLRSISLKISTSLPDVSRPSDLNGIWIFHIADSSGTFTLSYSGATQTLPIFIWECKCRRNTHFADRVAHLLYSLPTLLFALQPYKLVPLCTLLCDSIFRETHEIQYYKSRCLLSYKFIGTKMKRGSEREQKFVAGITRRVFERSVV